jgi:aspartyl-tRNA(Asn)/glutamyl-tRNA(Gln) amidotransferase subunit A
MKGILDGEPVDEFILNVAHTAFMCRTTEDAAILLQVLANDDMSLGKFTIDGDSASFTTKKPRIGIVKNFTASDEVRAAFLKTIDTFHALGYTTSDIDAPLEVQVDLKKGLI